MSSEGSPDFIRKFSKENSKEERDALAQKIRAGRSEYFGKKEERNGAVEEFNALSAKLDEYNSARFRTKVNDYFKMRATREKLGLASAKKEDADNELAGKGSADGQSEIAAFYQKEKEKWADAPYAKEDVAQQFTEEHLASLSVEDYALLLKRFPSEMVTHVTRQGIRDHTGMIYHSAGMGEFHNGFEKLASDGRLRSPLAVSLIEAQKEEDLMGLLKGRTLGGDECPPTTRAEAERRLAIRMEKYNDRNAVHFAADAVADHYYGSERGNEIFVAYPAAFVASQYHFGYRPLNGGVEEMHNDVYVYDTEEKGMDLDAGLVFIPKDARVDPATGSRYELGPDKQPKPNEATLAIADWVKSPEFLEQAELIRETTGNISSYEYPPVEKWEEIAASEYSGGRIDVARALLPFKQSLVSRGVTDPRILGTLLNYAAVVDFQDALRREKDESFMGEGYHIGSAVDRVLGNAGVRYAEAKETLSSEEYWEQKFKEHPEQRPSKVIFYEGGDPNKALRQWQEEHGLRKKTSDPDIGFAERRVGGDSQEAQTGAARFESMMRKAIDDRFLGQEAVPLEPVVNAEELIDDELPPPLPADEPFTI